MLEIEDRKTLLPSQMSGMHADILKSVQSAAKKYGAHVYSGSSSNWGSRTDRLSRVEDLIWQIIDEIAVPEIDD